jgi:nucleotide-binding universal stress UspA family protein
MGEEIGVTVRREVRVLVGGTVGDEIVKCAAADGCDLILVHAEQHAAHEELYCGRTIEQVLHKARCPVAVLLDPAQ